MVMLKKRVTNSGDVARLISQDATCSAPPHPRGRLVQAKDFCFGKPLLVTVVDLFMVAS
jgi:hypothetical protein